MNKQQVTQEFRDSLHANDPSARLAVMTGLGIGLAIRNIGPVSLEYILNALASKHLIEVRTVKREYLKYKEYIRETNAPGVIRCVGDLFVAHKYYENSTIELLGDYHTAFRSGMEYTPIAVDYYTDARPVVSEY